MSDLYGREKDTVSNTTTTCLYCQKEFSPKRGWAKFCSAAHRTSYCQAQTNPRVKDLLTVSDAARLRGVSEATIRKRVRRGDLQAFRLFGRLLIHKRQLP